MRRWRFFYLLIAWFVFSEQVYACKCLGPQKYDVVFEGRATKITDHGQTVELDRQYEILFSAARVKVGGSRSEVTVHTGSALVCGVSYEVGQSYLVHAVNKGYLLTKNCYGRKK